LAGTCRRGRGLVGGRPVVAGEDERREVDFLRKLDEPGQRGGPRIEDRRPRIDMRDVFEPARQRLHQLLLRTRRAKENARLVHSIPFVFSPARTINDAKKFQPAA
jgi:hypothetical protein